MGEEQRAIVHENIYYPRNFNKVLDVSKEMTNCNATYESKLCAEVVVSFKANRLSSETALTTAANIFNCNFGRRHRVYYSDGSSLNSASPTVDHISGVPSGVAVVYKLKRNGHWSVYFTPGNRGRDTIFTEIASIAHAMTIAKADWAFYLDDNRKHSNGKARWSKVTIFSDCVEALKRIFQLREGAIADAQSLFDPLLRQIMTVSQHFYDNGVQVELRWIKGHSGNEGNCLADIAAGYAANHQDVGMFFPEGLNWDKEPLSNDMKTHVPQQQNMSPKGKGQICRVIDWVAWLNRWTRNALELRKKNNMQARKNPHELKNTIRS
ncbi:hypothetical protein HDV62DRAFT_354885 [Trichoderma sp. SZMC 28011]